LPGDEVVHGRLSRVGRGRICIGIGEARGPVSAFVGVGPNFLTVSDKSCTSSLNGSPK
jgi:hypothetical protein